METSQLIELGKVQKIFLVITSVLLALILLFFRTGLSSDKPLDILARNSLSPELALKNGHPTIIEFYADWCEACQEMAPTMLTLKKEYQNELDIVLLNVDNDQWLDLIEKYDVNGIPQLNLFDQYGDMNGISIGLKNIEQINQIASSLLDNKPLPEVLLINKNTEGKALFSRISKDISTNSIGPKSHG